MRKFHLRKSTEILLIVLAMVVVIGSTVIIAFRAELFAQPEPGESDITDYPVSQLSVDTSSGYWATVNETDKCGFTAGWKDPIGLDKYQGTGVNTSNIKWNINLDVGGDEILKDKKFDYNTKIWTSDLNKNWCGKRARLTIETYYNGKIITSGSSVSIGFTINPAVYEGSSPEGTCPPENAKAFIRHYNQGGALTHALYITWDPPSSQTCKNSGCGAQITGRAKVKLPSGKEINGNFNRGWHYSDRDFTKEELGNYVIRNFDKSGNPCGNITINVSSLFPPGTHYSINEEGNSVSNEEGTNESINNETDNPELEEITCDQICGDNNIKWYEYIFPSYAIAKRVYNFITDPNDPIEKAICHVNCRVLEAIGFLFNWAMMFLEGAIGIA